MKVKELINLLSKCDQEAEVNAECWEDVEVKVVAEYTNGKETLVEIGDDLTYIDDLLVKNDDYKKQVIE